MKIIQMNATCGFGSTGKICRAISGLLHEESIENYILYSTGKSDYPLGVCTSNNGYIKLQAIKARILGNYGFHSRLVTKRIIQKLNKIQPDIVHLHNIHGHDCNLEMLFTYFQKNKTKLIWTFHDCWAFTGYCTHFTTAECYKWKSECKECVQKKTYSLLFDRSQMLYRKKKQLFKNLDLMIVTPSQWLSEIVKESFLKDYPISVINNGINQNVFSPIKSGFREKYKISENKYIVLAISGVWDEKKGLDVLKVLAENLNHSIYQIVIVGTNGSIDKQLPSNIISIHRTQDQHELAEIYSAADVFINPTREDNFPTVNIEALACGTPVVTFRTGGSPEILDESCGSVVECDDIKALTGEIERVCMKKIFTEEDCRKRALDFDEKEKFREYIDLYKEVLTK